MEPSEHAKKIDPGEREEILKTKIREYRKRGYNEELTAHALQVEDRPPNVDREIENARQAAEGFYEAAERLEDRLDALQ